MWNPINTIEDAMNILSNIIAIGTLGALSTPGGQPRRTTDAERKEIDQIINDYKTGITTKEITIQKTNYTISQMSGQTNTTTKKKKDTTPINTKRLIDMAIKATTEFLEELSQRLDFELATKTNPKNPLGEFIDGKFQVLNFYRTTGKFVKNLIGYKILYQITGTEKAIKTADEEPIEQALREIYKLPAVVPTPPPVAITPPAPLPTPQLAQTRQPPPPPIETIQLPIPTTTESNKPTFIKYEGSPNVFNRYTGKWISPEQAQTLGVFNAGAVQNISTPRPEVKKGSDYQIYNNRDLSVFPI